MKEFQDESGVLWIASVRERTGEDYKGRFGLSLSPKNGTPASAVSLEDVRWNSAKTAERTLRTMSEVELRRRLRIALGRNSPG